MNIWKWAFFLIFTASLVMSIGVIDSAAQAQSAPNDERTDERTDMRKDGEPSSIDNLRPSSAESELIIDDDGDTGEVIVVIGSRIRSDGLDQTGPVLQLNRDDIERSGATSVGELLQRLPISGGAINTKFNSSGNFGFPPDGGGIGAGAARIDLRYLNAKRVLVLVDGVRWIHGSSGTGVPAAVDLNTIPLNMIERIEVLRDGASPIYGSDAIGGVINIITRKHLDGVQAHAFTGAFGQGDGLTQRYEVSWGNRYDRASVAVGLSYVDQRRVASSDRDISKNRVPFDTRCVRGRCSTTTPQGRFVFDDPVSGERVDLALDTGVGDVPRYSSDGIDDDFHPFDTDDLFNWAPYNLVLTPSKRFAAFSNLRYRVTPSVTAHAGVSFNHRTSLNQGAPEPIYFGSTLGAGNRASTIEVDVTNPYNPLGFTLGEEHNYLILRRPLEAGPRIFEQTVNTWYASGGLRGDIAMGERRFYWDATAAFSKNRGDQIKTGGFNLAKIERALGPVDECLEARDGCVPLNIFGGQGSDGESTLTPEMLDYIMFTQKDVSEQQLIDLTATISGKVLTLPGGDIGVAMGVEHRRQEGFYQPDSVVVAQDSGGVPSLPTSGSYSSNEGYAEMQVPIVRDVPGARLIDTSMALRLSDYTSFGSKLTYRVGTRWQPMADLLVHGAYTEGFRAPGIGELYGGQAQFDQTLVDPCADILGEETGMPAAPEIAENCIARGVPADGSYRGAGQVAISTGGNSELKSETSSGLTVGFAYSPSAMRNKRWSNNLDIELTYYRVDVDNAIQAVDAQVRIDLCVRTLDPAFCDGITRSSTGLITQFANVLTNIGGITTDGVDLTLRYTAPATGLGQFRITSLNTFLNRFIEEIPASAGFEEVRREGLELGSPERAFPRFKSNLLLDWARKDWRVSFATRYIHSVTEKCRGFSALPGLCSDPDMDDDTLSTNKLGAMIYNDIQISWRPRSFNSLLDFSLGVNNLFNRDPPACYSCSLNGFDATTYEVPGAFGYFRAGYRM